MEHCSIFCILMKIFELLYYIVGVIALATVAINIKQYRKSVEKEKDDLEKEKRKNTLEILRSFYLVIYPKYNRYITSYKHEFFSLDSNTYIEDTRDISDNAESYLTNFCDITEKEQMKEIINELEMLSLSLETLPYNNDIVKKIISEKYLEVFQTVCPVIINKKDIDLYKISIKFYNEWKLSAANERNLAEKKELEDTKTRVLTKNLYEQ